jgi:hypothetical protein
MGTVFERSKIPLSKWLATLFLLANDPNTPVMHIHRVLGISYKSSWFLVERLRRALQGSEFDAHVSDPKQDARPHPVEKRSNTHSPIPGWLEAKRN